MGAMVTTCPHCQTTFKVSSEQLNAHEGDVRCGQCATVFNAYDSLASTDAKRNTQAEVPKLVTAPETLSEALPVASEAISPTSVEFPEYQYESLEQITYSSLPEPGLDTETQMEEEPTPSLPLNAIEPSPLVEDTQPITIMPESDDFTVTDDQLFPARKLTWLWVTGCILMLGALLYQPVHFRYQLAYFSGNNFNNNGFGIHGSLSQALTELGAELVVLCNRAPCTGRHDLLNYADNMSIESSELQADPARPTVVILNAVLHNHAKFPQNYPSLELTLTDTEDKPSARRTFKPTEYLSSPSNMANIKNGMAAGSEITIKLYLDTQTIKATGYRLYVYYPANTH